MNEANTRSLHIRIVRYVALRTESPYFRRRTPIGTYLVSRTYRKGCYKKKNVASAGRDYRQVESLFIGTVYVRAS